MPAARAISSVLFLLALAAFGVLAWALRKLMVLDRGFELGDVVVFGVFAIFGCFCAAIGWHFYRMPAEASSPAPSTSPKRVTISQVFATAGVLLLILSVLVPADWYPVVLLFTGLALLAVSHVLTPCEERIAKLRKARSSLEQL